MKARRYECVLEPGDLLFIPGMEARGVKKHLGGTRDGRSVGKAVHMTYSMETECVTTDSTDSLNLSIESLVDIRSHNIPISCVF